jgi:hypothetical protein
MVAVINMIFDCWCWPQWPGYSSVAFLLWCYFPASVRRLTEIFTLTDKNSREEKPSIQCDFLCFFKTSLECLCVHILSVYLARPACHHSIQSPQWIPRTGIHLCLYTFYCLSREWLLLSFLTIWLMLAFEDLTRKFCFTYETFLEQPNPFLNSKWY